ncbi:MAG: DUF5060 domain-containing protein [Verrucomicrobiota bacterium]
MLKRILEGLFLFCTLAAAFAQTLPRAVPLNSPSLWQRYELRVEEVPIFANPFDPDLIRVDARFDFPSGKTMVVPAFWYQAFQRTLQNGSERLTAGAADWRARFVPTEPGEYSVVVTVTTTNPAGSVSSTPLRFLVGDNPLPARRGYVRIGASGKYFETGDGQALPLIGANVCWPGGRGTYDYDTWFAGMSAARENFARLWMAPWYFGLETEPGTLTRYRLDRAWQLDYVLRLAEQRGIYVLLCLDFHGMFETKPDVWGGNNFWPKNPYNTANGGPAANQNAFFTSASARAAYQKRLRYLVARYGYSPNLLGWEFFNEIDNVYAYLNSTDVANWHRAMGDWLDANDPFHHLVTTSLTGNSDRAEIWSLPQLDFAAYHSYNEPNPVLRLSSVTQSFLQRYRKPVMIGEFGIDWRGWSREQDPHLRGLRQGLWAGALGGSVGTSMSWWWENLHSENTYPLFQAVGKILSPTSWGKGDWKPISFKTSGPPPVTVGDPIAGQSPFQATLRLSGQWGGKPLGQLAVANPAAADLAPTTLNGFVHGTAHSDLRTSFRLSAWLTNDARIVMHLNSVSDGAILTVRVDGVETFRRSLPNRDGGYEVNNEYNEDIPVSLAAGKHLIEIRNAGADWFFLDWVRLEQVLPASYPGGWEPSPVAIGLQGQHMSLLYVVAPGAAFPAGATNTALPVQSGKSVVITNSPAGKFGAQWFDPKTGQLIAEKQHEATNGTLTLPLPDFREDLTGLITLRPRLQALRMQASGAFQFRLESDPGARFQIESSTDLARWSDALVVTNELTGATTNSISQSPSARQEFFRARRVN